MIMSNMQKNITTRIKYNNKIKNEHIGGENIMRILVSCANGSGTSLMMMAIEKAMKELGVNYQNPSLCNF